ncbi:MAG: hypothetical protein QME81_03110 [bacterium]|nr:hypothetical protein [bacterium]
MPQTVQVPVELLTRMTKSFHLFEELSEELEDYLLTQDPAFIAKMRRARDSHLSGNVKPLEELEKKLCIK